jgi:S1-C subfamily serine protease
VSAVDLRGPAYRAGVRQGDLILEVDGNGVPDKAAYHKVLASVRAEAVSRLYVRRGGKSLFFGLRRDTPAAARAESGSAGHAAK